MPLRLPAPLLPPLHPRGRLSPDSARAVFARIHALPLRAPSPPFRVCIPAHCPAAPHSRSLRAACTTHDLTPAPGLLILPLTLSALPPALIRPHLNINPRPISSILVPVTVNPMPPIQSLRCCPNTGPCSRRRAPLYHTGASYYDTLRSGQPLRPRARSRTFNISLHALALSLARGGLRVLFSAPQSCSNCGPSTLAPALSRRFISEL
ncbi:hypothetical protein DFH09DRAFT_1327900 [Mycena vulgaris]|nr:hypothetical protein DFH09DRAFT_1327900 [Mycena vulgaris]